MNRNELDEAISKVRSDQPADEVVKTAAGRVFRKLLDSSFITAEPTGKIRGCADVRALIPAYLNRTLSGPRSLLLEDHILTCIDCRHAVQEARAGTPPIRPIPIQRAHRPRVPFLVWAAAAMLIIGIGLGVTGRLPGQKLLDAKVDSITGTLYKVTDIGVSLVEAGAILNNTDELRTAKGSHAILRLAGGTIVEIAERSDVSLSRSGWRGTSLNLERGQMIVDTHNQSPKSLSVTSGDLTVPVSSGVFAFNHGSKDSRVAVAQGSADVSTGATTQHVAAGHLYGGELRNVNLSIASEFAWSQNSASYQALLQQFAGLQKDFNAIPAPDLRYSTQLAQYLPASTFLYAAIPNLGGTISEAKKIFDTRLSESDVLRQWWQQQSISKNGQFDRIVDQISSFSSYLGDEIVVSTSGAASGDNAGIVFLAQIKQPGLAAYLESVLPSNQSVQIVTAGTIPSGANKLFIDLDNNVFVASTSAAQLQNIESVMQQNAPGNFTTTPFYSTSIGKIYAGGAGSFVAVNLEQIVSKSVSSAKTVMPSGFENIQYLVLERKQNSGDTQLRAAVTFNGSRQGVASWLATPGPAGSLDFVSPDASFATSLVMKSPRAMLQELLGMLGGSDANFTQQLDEFQAHAGVSLLDDVAAPLGNDITIAMDANLTPVLALEVNDPNRLQQTLNVFVARFNQQASANAGRLTLTSQQVNGRTFYAISNSKASSLAVYYTFADGYLVASSSALNVQQAMQYQQNGHTLANSDNFRAKLPADGYSNFSAMVYSNLNSALGDLAKQKGLAGLVAGSGPGLICVYGDTDRIVAAAKGSFLGFDLGTLIKLQQGSPLKTMMASTPLANKGIVN